METSQTDRRLTIPEDVYSALQRYSTEEKKRMKNPLIADLITPLSLAQHILLNEVQKRGYYEGKVRRTKV